MKNRFLLFLLTIFLPPCLWAQQMYWAFDERAYQYDMRAYISLKSDGVVITDLSNYEIAAFCGRECRGLVLPERDILNPTGGCQIATMIIKSNENSAPETITFKVYDKAEGRVIIVQGVSFSFVSDATQGAVSQPIILDITQRHTLGDVNGDGEIDIEDVYMVIDFVNGRDVADVIEAAADMNGDGFVDEDDINMIIDKALGK